MLKRFFVEGGWPAYATATVVAASTAFAGAEVEQALSTRNRWTEEQSVNAVAVTRVDSATRSLRVLRDSVVTTRARGAAPNVAPYIIVSLAENRLWVRESGDDIFTTRVASGSGRTLVGNGRGQQYKFDTPRGRLTVLSKETAPAWVPPDWHFVEKAGRKKAGILRMRRGQIIPVSDGVITTRGSEVIKRGRDGSVQVLTATDGSELFAGGKIIIPPFGTNARRYKEILGTHRLNLGDGYALHGTNNPNSIGGSVSHGCVRLRNEDIETLYRMIPVGTAVYIY